MARSIAVKLPHQLEESASRSTLVPFLGEESDHIGFLWNSKPNGDVVLDVFADQLRSIGYRSTGFTHWMKPVSAAPADDQLISRMAQRSKAVVLAVGD